LQVTRKNSKYFFSDSSSTIRPIRNPISTALARSSRLKSSFTGSSFESLEGLGSDEDDAPCEVPKMINNNKNDNKKLTISLIQKKSVKKYLKKGKK